MSASSGTVTPKSYLLSCPDEVLTAFVSYVVCKADLASLRLTNCQFEAIATPFYFASVPLYAQWERGDGNAFVKSPSDVDYDVRVFAHILDNERFKRMVKKVDVYTCNPDCVSAVSCQARHFGSQ